MKKKRVEKKNKKKIGNGFGIVSFILVIISIIILILVYSYYLPSSLAGSLILFYPLFILASLVLSIIQNSRKPTRLSKISFILSLLGLISIILFSIFLIYSGDPVNQDCVDVRLSIESIDKDADTVTIKRLAGGSKIEVSDVKVAAENGEFKVLSAVSSVGEPIDELETKTVNFSGVVDIVNGTVIQVAAVVKDNEVERICAATDRRVA